MITWRQMAEAIEDIYGGYVDWREEYFLCPECSEPIYREDYPRMAEWVCPVCEELLEH